MKYFSKSFTQFFIELAPNNNKEWFDVNRKRYETDVKKPFEVFISDLLERAREVDNTITISYKEAIFRINKDVRFSKDKEPYKLNRSAIISSVGTKDKSIPGLYLEITPEEVGIYGGLYMPDKNQLQRVREEIASNLKPFEKLINDKDFVETFGTIQGEKNARLPKEFQEAAKKQSLIANKQFYYYTSLPVDIIYTDDFLDIVMAHYTIAKPLCDFFMKPVRG